MKITISEHLFNDLWFSLLLSLKPINTHSQKQNCQQNCYETDWEIWVYCIIPSNVSTNFFFSPFALSFNKKCPKHENHSAK